MAMPREQSKSLDLSEGARLDVEGKKLRSASSSGWAIGLSILFVLGVVGILVQVVPGWRHLYLQQNLADAFLPPFSHGYILGTDNLGRDMCWRLIGGLGISLGIGVGVSILSIVFGLVLGISRPSSAGRPTPYRTWPST